MQDDNASAINGLMEKDEQDLFQAERHEVHEVEGCRSAFHALKANYKKDRDVIFQDAVEWMYESDEPFTGSIFTGIPDMLDVHETTTGSSSSSNNGSNNNSSSSSGASLSTCSKSRRKEVGCEQLAEEYTAWLHKCALRLFSRLAPGECAIFSQTDTKVVDEATGRVLQWLDKSHLLSVAAEQVPGVKLLWHKIALDAAAADSSHRPCYTHVLCFGKHFTYPVSAFATPDIIDRGQMTWLKATGIHLHQE